MNLLDDAIDRARSLARSGQYEEAERVVAKAAPALEAEQDVSVLRRFAELCNHWGPEDLEEAALRALLRQSPDLVASPSSAGDPASRGSGNPALPVSSSVSDRESGPGCRRKNPC